MNSNKLLEVLQLIHEVFPLPENEDFKGTHAFLIDRETGLLSLRVWFLVDGKVKGRNLLFDGNEEITKELLLEVADAVRSSD